MDVIEIGSSSEDSSEDEDSDSDSDKDTDRMKDTHVSAPDYRDSVRHNYQRRRFHAPISEDKC